MHEYTFLHLGDFCLFAYIVLVEHVKNTKPMAGFDEVLVPGEPERRTAAERKKNGIPLDDNSWAQIRAVADTVSN